MRIAVVTTSYPRRNGDYAGHFVRSEVEVLRKAGHDVTVFAPGPGWRATACRDGTVWLPGARLFRAPGALTHLAHRPWLSADAWRFVQAARRAIRQGTWDRVIAHWLVPCGWPVAQAVQAPCEIVVHGSDARLLLAMPRPISGVIVRRLVRREAQLRFVSSELKQRFGEHFGPAFEGRCRVQPCAIDVPRYARDESRQLLGMNTNRPIAIVVGRLVASKRIDSALMYRKYLPDHQWLVVGDGPARPRLQHSFPAVRFLGELEREQTLRWISAADVLVCASLAEGAPTVVREARALGTRVIAAAVGDLVAWAQTDDGITIDRRLEA